MLQPSQLSYWHQNPMHFFVKLNIRSFVVGGWKEFRIKNFECFCALHKDMQVIKIPMNKLIWRFRWLANINTANVWESPINRLKHFKHIILVIHHPKFFIDLANCDYIMHWVFA
ncbi:MAG: hypothetical protein [Podoviridae sp. ctbh1]|nr:MAG: hypothetical protein [Podoviridae sp. ctbh1]